MESQYTSLAVRATSPPNPEEPVEGLWARGQDAHWQSPWAGLAIRWSARSRQERLPHVSGYRILSGELVEVAIERWVSTAAPHDPDLSECMGQIATCIGNHFVYYDQTRILDLMESLHAAENRYNRFGQRQQKKPFQRYSGVSGTKMSAPNPLNPVIYEAASP